MNRYNLVFASRVDIQLLQHFRFIKNVSIPAAIRFRDDFSKAIHEISDNPFQFPIDTDLNLPEGLYHKTIFAKWYKILFLVKDNTVYIDAVVDCRQRF